ncbi:MAG: 30S ribosomal protein S8 [Candidatus Aureabacteria bacterium]|nr:30S ribosomal protein S8 [Candidatus Auribacterota bacterium]
MTMTDPIADMLTRIRNSMRARQTSVDIPASKIKKEIARILHEKGFIKSYRVVDYKVQGMIRIEFKETKGKKHSALNNLKRISTPGRRMYVSGKEIKPVLGGIGVSIISTSQGVMTNKEARVKGIGGEVLLNVW